MPVSSVLLCNMARASVAHWVRPTLLDVTAAPTLAPASVKPASVSAAIKSFLSAAKAFLGLTVWLYEGGYPKTGTFCRHNIPPCNFSNPHPLQLSELLLTLLTLLTLLSPLSLLSGQRSKSPQISQEALNLHIQFKYELFTIEVMPFKRNLRHQTERLASSGYRGLPEIIKWLFGGLEGEFSVFKLDQFYQLLNARGYL